MYAINITTTCTVTSYANGIQVKLTTYTEGKFKEAKGVMCILLLMVLLLLQLLLLRKLRVWIYMNKLSRNI